jgi:hypothetical protein
MLVAAIVLFFGTETFFKPRRLQANDFDFNPAKALPDVRSLHVPDGLQVASLEASINHPVHLLLLLLLDVLPQKSKSDSNAVHLLYLEPCP